MAATHADARAEANRRASTEGSEMRIYVDRCRGVVGYVVCGPGERAPAGAELVEEIRFARRSACERDQGPCVR